MVHFTVYGPRALLYSGVRVRALRHAGYPIRIPADHWALAPPRGLSRLAASFVAVRLHRHPPWTYDCLAVSPFPGDAAPFFPPPRRGLSQPRRRVFSFLPSLVSLSKNFLHGE